MPRPKISVVIPAYNASLTLTRALETVLAQSESAYEVIVVDDGSSDDLSYVQSRFKDRVIWIRQTNQGAAAARNTGVAKATGSHIAFLDADDYWETNKLELQSAVFQKESRVGLCASVCMSEEPGATRKVMSQRIGCSPKWDQVLEMEGPDAFDTACCLITSSVMVDRLALGLEPFQCGYEPAEDRELWVRLVMRIPVYYLSHPTTTLVLVPGSLSRTNIDRDCSNMLRVVEKFGDLLGRSGLRRWRARTYRRWAADYLQCGESKAAIGPATRYVALQPWSQQAWWILAKALIAPVGRFCRKRLPPSNLRKIDEERG